MVKNVEVCLVNMPMGDVKRPSLGLSLLQAILHQGGIGCRVDYANLRFFAMAGVDMLRLLGFTRAEDQLAEWLFANTAFPDFKIDDERFLQRLIARNSLLRKQDAQSVCDQLLGLRSQISNFVDGVARSLLESGPVIVGCSSTFQQNVASLALLRRLRELNPSIVTMMGGANCEGIMGLTLHESFPWVDFVVSGEADRLIVPLCRRIIDEGRDIAVEDISTAIFSPNFRNKSAYADLDQSNPIPRAITQELTDLPSPDFSDYFSELDSNRYRQFILPGLPFETSRGCWWGSVSHCTFCGLNGGGIGYRVKSAERVAKELEELSDRYGIKRMEAVDNILDMAYFKTLLKTLEQNDYTLFFETKANLNRGHIEQLYRAGVRWIQPGIESLDSRVLKLMHKGFAAWQNIQLLKWCRQFGLRVAWTIITGFPGEEDEWYVEMATLIPSLTHLLPGGFTRLRYDRFSLYHNDPAKYGLDLQPSELYAYVYPLSLEKLANLAYFFEPGGEPELSRKLTHVDGMLTSGRDAVRLAVEEWGDQWKQIPVVLSSRQVPGELGDELRLEINDSRRCAYLPRYHIVGLSADILGLCDSAVTPKQLEALLPTQLSLDSEPVTSAIHELIDKKLLLYVDGRYLALVLQEPFKPLFPPVFPGGHLLQKAFTQ